MPKLQRLAFHLNQFQGDGVSLNPAQTRYLTKVLRLKANDLFIAMDGHGHWWLAELNADAMTAALVEPMQVNHELPIQVTLVASPPKGKGFEEVVHGATELGVRHIYPLLSARTQVKPSQQKLSRWQKIATEASEQSMRQFIPQVHAPIMVSQLSQILPSSADATILFCSTQPQAQHLAQVLKSTGGQPVIVFTGPEGGWTSQEEAMLTELGGIGVSLGRRVLRAVTAPICALSLIASHAEVSPWE